ncbi:MAG: PAS domain S-box protein [Verrucomicrobiota bacterium]
MATPIQGKQNKSSRLDRLRYSAEGRLRKSPNPISRTQGWDVPKLIHELEVHQIELEMQNEELRRTHLELEASRDRFSMLYDFAPVGYLTLDDRGVIREANLTVARLLGIERAKCIGQSLRRYVAKTCQRDLYLHWQQVFNANAKPFCELQMVGPAGKIFRARFDTVVWPNQSPSRECLVALSDISARKEAEAARARLAAIVESSSDCISSLTLEGIVNSWNKGAERIYGYQAEEILGRPLSLLFPPDRRREFRQAVEHIQRGQAVAPFESVDIRKDGQPIDVFLALSPIKDDTGRVTGIAHVARDISERKRAEMALRESEKSLNDFFEQSPLSLFWVGLDGYIQRVNRAGLDLLGVSVERCLSHPISRFLADPEIGLHALTQLARNQTLQNFRARVRFKDGSVRHVLIDANGLWERGALMYSRWFVRDITDRVELEREILGVSEREQQRLGQDLHDDLCQQLSGIEFLSQTLARHLATTSKSGAARAREIAKMVRLAIDHARDLAHGLSPARLEGDGLTIALQQLAARTERIFHIDCRFRSDAPILIDGNATGIHLYRIAQEAISNAIKHGRASIIDIGLTNHNKDIVLAIRDSGIGIPIKLRKRKGMGLRVMQYRAGVIGGSLVVQRQPTGGTTVVCTIKRGIHNHENPNES